MTTIPDDAPMMPTSIDYAEETATLFVGTGTIAPVQKKVWEYDISGVRVIRRWFERRKKEPEGRKFSPLDSISPATWSPEWTTELLEMINMISMLTDLDPAQEALLDRLLASPLVSVADLTAADLLPPQELVKPEKARARGSLFDAGPS